ncbi:hypothetical protein BGX27_009499 [Mortierella sp. AM989]|nr:hypothetical protein BGX27_009499 [Mortierella sp. AM989]
MALRTVPDSVLTFALEHDTYREGFQIPSLDDGYSLDTLKNIADTKIVLYNYRSEMYKELVRDSSRKKISYIYKSGEVLSTEGIPTASSPEEGQKLIRGLVETAIAERSEKSELRYAVNGTFYERWIGLDTRPNNNYETVRYKYHGDSLRKISDNEFYSISIHVINDAVQHLKYTLSERPETVDREFVEMLEEFARKSQAQGESFVNAYEYRYFLEVIGQLRALNPPSFREAAVGLDKAMEIAQEQTGSGEDVMLKHEGHYFRMRNYTLQAITEEPELNGTEDIAAWAGSTRKWSEYFGSSYAETLRQWIEDHRIESARFDQFKQESGYTA